MSDTDLYISFGQCFYGEGQASDKRFIPCGNAAVSGTQACCFQGDFCLSTNACYDNDTSVTYITGCTDATYSSSKCPHKAGYPDQQWVALARCDGADIDLFSGCGHHPEAIAIKHEDCTCDAASALISNPVSGQPTLNQIGRLPTTAGGTISFNPTALPTATSSASGSGGGGLSSGARVGVGVGVGVGVPVIAAAVLTFLFFRRRKELRTSHDQEQTSQHPALPDDTAHDTPGPMMMLQRSPPPTYSPDARDARHGWQAYKPELHGESAHKVELPAEEGMGGHDDSSGNGIGGGGGGGTHRENSIQRTPFESYPPPGGYPVDRGRHGGETPPLPPFVSPQSTGAADRPASGGGHQRTGSSGMNPHRFGGDGQYL